MVEKGLLTFFAEKRRAGMLMGTTFSSNSSQSCWKSDPISKPKLATPNDPYMTSEISPEAGYKKSGCEPAHNLYPLLVVGLTDSLDRSFSALQGTRLLHNSSRLEIQVPIQVMVRDSLVDMGRYLIHLPLQT